MNDHTAARMATYIRQHAARHPDEGLPPCDRYVDQLGDILFRGAHDDDLAADRLAAIEAMKPGAYERKHLTACERRECLDALPVGAECFQCGAVALEGEPCGCDQTNTCSQHTVDNHEYHGGAAGSFASDGCRDCEDGES